jgi:hypothetical protein
MLSHPAAAATAVAVDGMISEIIMAGETRQHCEQQQGHLQAAGVCCQTSPYVVLMLRNAQRTKGCPL